MNIELNAAAIIRPFDPSRERIVVYEIEIDKTVCYKESYTPIGSDNLANESRAELFAIQRLLKKCTEEVLIFDADIVINFLETSHYAKFYKSELNCSVSNSAPKLQALITYLQNSLEILRSRNCRISFKEKPNFKAELIEYAEHERKKDTLTSTYDIVQDYLAKYKDLNNIQVSNERTDLQYNSSVIPINLDTNVDDKNLMLDESNTTQDDVHFIPSFSQNTVDTPTEDTISIQEENSIDSEINLQPIENDEEVLLLHHYSVNDCKKKIANLEKLYNTATQEKKNANKSMLDESNVTQDDVHFIPSFSQNTVDTPTEDTISIQEENSTGSEISSQPEQNDAKTLSVYADNVKAYKEQRANLKDFYNTFNKDKNDSNKAYEHSEHLLLLSEELNSIKTQCDFLDNEILQIQREIEETTLLKEAEEQECDVLIKEMAKLDVRLSELTQFLEDNINVMAKLDCDVLFTTELLHEKSNYLKSLDKKIENIKADNSHIINYLREQIENAAFEKVLLLQRTRNGRL